MLLKSSIITVVPGTPGRDATPATHECMNMDGGVGGISDGGDPTAPGGGTDPSGGTGSYTPAAGEFILLHDNGGGYTTSVAPAPAGYSCRYETNPVITTGATYINVVVCEEP